MATAVRVDYHVHTSFSYDSTITPEALVERASAAGLRAVGVTDHDTVEGALAARELAPPGLHVLVGCEFTADDGSHVLGLDLQAAIAERRVPELLEAIREQGGLVVLPHPFRRGSGIFRREAGRPAAFVDGVLALADLVECFNGADSWEHNRRNYQLAVERGLPAVAGSDAHAPAAVGSVFVEYDDEAPVHGVSRRRVFGPAQRPAPENVLKRRLMEGYHRHRAAMPAVVHDAYRWSRRQLGREVARTVSRQPRLQFELPLTTPGGGSAHGT